MSSEIRVCQSNASVVYFWFLQRLLEYFSDYALVHVALYGKALVPAAKDTWNMFKVSTTLYASFYKEPVYVEILHFSNADGKQSSTTHCKWFSS